MHDGSSTTPGPVIPGWRVIRSDAGRFWASRVEPFPEETEWHAPPFRTVDGDTFDALRAEVAVQEEAAGRITAASADSAASAAPVQAAGREPAGRTAAGQGPLRAAETGEGAAR